MILSVVQIIRIAKISQYLASNDIRKAGLFGGGMDIELPRKIKNIREDVEYWYDLDPSETSLSATSKYLYALCGKYALAAQAVTGTGGSIAPVNPSSSIPPPIEFVVDASTSYMIDGQSSKTISQFVGYNVIFNRDNIPQAQVNTNGTYFTWNRITGLFTVYGAAATDELFSINAI